MFILCRSSGRFWRRAIINIMTNQTTVITIFIQPFIEKRNPTGLLLSHNISKPEAKGKDVSISILNRIYLRHIRPGELSLSSSKIFPIPFPILIALRVVIYWRGSP
jgi:hypothetical protein